MGEAVGWSDTKQPTARVTGVLVSLCALVSHLCLFSVGCSLRQSKSASTASVWPNRTASRITSKYSERWCSRAKQRSKLAHPPFKPNGAAPQSLASRRMRMRIFFLRLLAIARLCMRTCMLLLFALHHTFLADHISNISFSKDSESDLEVSTAASVSSLSSCCPHVGSTACHRAVRRTSRPLLTAFPGTESSACRWR